MSAEHLALPDGSFDTVLCTLSLCTIPDPVRALREMARVCSPMGKVLLLEHVRSHSRVLGKLQDWATPWQSQRIGCHFNRDTEANVHLAGLTVEAVEPHYWGVVKLIEARP